MLQDSDGYDVMMSCDIEQWFLVTWSLRQLDIQIIFASQLSSQSIWNKDWEVAWLIYDYFRDYYTL